jgi:hypothetical protein
MDNPGDLYPNTSGKYKPIAARAAATSTSSSSSFGPAAPLLTASAPPFFSGPVAAAPLTSSTNGLKRPLKPRTTHQIIELGSGNKITTNNQNQLIIDGQIEDYSSPLDISPKGGYFLSIYDQSTQNNIFPIGNILLYKDGNTNSLRLDYQVNKNGMVVDYKSGFNDDMHIHATPAKGSSQQRVPGSRSSSSQPAAVAKEEHIIILDKNDKPIELNCSEVEKLLEQYKSVIYIPNQGALLKINHYVNQFVDIKPNNVQNIEFIQFYTENGSMFIKIKINNKWSYDEKFGDDLIIQFSCDSNSSSKSGQPHNLLTAKLVEAQEQTFTRVPAEQSQQTSAPKKIQTYVTFKPKMGYFHNINGVIYNDEHDYSYDFPIKVTSENGYNMVIKRGNVEIPLGIEIIIDKNNNNNLFVVANNDQHYFLCDNKDLNESSQMDLIILKSTSGKGESLLIAGACGAAELSLKSINRFLVIVLIVLLLIIIWSQRRQLCKFIDEIKLFNRDSPKVRTNLLKKLHQKNL